MISKRRLIFDLFFICIFKSGMIVAGKLVFVADLRISTGKYYKGCILKTPVLSLLI